MNSNNIRFRGNPRHLALMNEAVDQSDISRWNLFVRREGPYFRPRLAGADFSGKDLREIRLDGADLTDVDFSGSQLCRANLNNARLRGCNLFEANLSHARMSHADFTNANLRKARMTGVKARGAVLVGADLSETILDEADLNQASMHGASVTGSSRYGVKMKAKVRVRTQNGTTGSRKTPDTVKEGTSRAWIRALDEEQQLKEIRKVREKEQKEAEQKRLNRRLGRKQPLFNRIK